MEGKQVGGDKRKSRTRSGKEEIRYSKRKRNHWNFKKQGGG